MHHESKRHRRGVTFRPVGALIALLVGLVALASIATPALGKTVTNGGFAPTGTSFADPVCQNSSHYVQAPGGLSASCVGPTPSKIVYSFGTIPIPAEATNIRYKVSFLGHSGSGGGSLSVRIFPTGQQSAPGQTLALAPSLGGHSTNFSNFNFNWTPTMAVSASMEWYAGSSVHWDELVLIVAYDMPDKANVGISVSGPSQLLGGTEFTYAVTVTNHGPDVAKYVILTTVLPDGIATSYNVAGCTNSPNGLPNCTLGDIPSGGSRLVTVHAYAMLSATGPKTATFFASTASEDEVLGNNGASHTVTVAGKRTLDVCKQWDDNGDGQFEGSRDFVIRVSPPNGASPIDTSITVAEGGTKCVPVSTIDAALTVAEVGQTGFAEAPGHPYWRVGSGTGQGAVSVPVGVDRVTFVSRKVAPPTPTATATNTPQATPTKTATPAPTATKTPAPSATPTRTATPKATATPASNSPTQTPAPISTAAPQQPQSPAPVATTAPASPSTPETGTPAATTETGPTDEAEPGDREEEHPGETVEPNTPGDAESPGEGTTGEKPADEQDEANPVEENQPKPGDGGDEPKYSKNMTGQWIAIGTGLAAIGSLAFVAPAVLRRKREQ